MGQQTNVTVRAQSFGGVVDNVEKYLSQLFSQQTPEGMANIIGQMTNISQQQKLAMLNALGIDGQDAYYTNTSVPLAAYKVICLTGVGEYGYASSNSSPHARRVLGVTTRFIAAGEQLVVKQKGSISNPEWNWNIDLPVWLGLNGDLTQREPDVSFGDEFSLVLGYPLDAVTINLQTEQPVYFE